MTGETVGQLGHQEYQGNPDKKVQSCWWSLKSFILLADFSSSDKVSFLLQVMLAQKVRKV